MRWRRTPVRLTARVTVASYWTSGERRVVSQELWPCCFLQSMPAGEHIVALLTSLPQIQLLADRYLIWQVVLPLVGVWCYLLDGMFIGATRAAEMRNSMAVAAGGFALTLFALPVLGNHGLWLALTVFLALRGLSLSLIWRRHWREGTWFARS